MLHAYKSTRTHVGSPKQSYENHCDAVLRFLRISYPPNLYVCVISKCCVFNAWLMISNQHILTHVILACCMSCYLLHVSQVLLSYTTMIPVPWWMGLYNRVTPSVLNSWAFKGTNHHNFSQMWNVFKRSLHVSGVYISPCWIFTGYCFPSKHQSN